MIISEFCLSAVINIHIYAMTS